ncbi:hypothetical protein CW354_01615 [Marinicaulis flavus]|uniref:TonB-dependent receptor-like beta-barrel domain-containing protein n=2 Tax=Hyphococcus luteus TaxID=2058213 RepID=A0A2S7KAP3_9PROT|nr:hypothetical protein CW354_01615 [Marinicaulis flavus]
MPDPFSFVMAPVVGPETFSAFTPKFGLEFQVNDNVLLYARPKGASKAADAISAAANSRRSLLKKIWAFEREGGGSALFSNRLRLNTAYFHYVYKDVQAQDSVQNQSLIRNVGKAVVDGAMGCRSVSNID